jgi:hypothetical protein
MAEVVWFSFFVMDASSLEHVLLLLALLACFVLDFILSKCGGKRERKISFSFLTTTPFLTTHRKKCNRSIE